MGMTPDEAIAFWFNRIDFERRPPKPGDLRLDRMRALLDRLGNPQDELRIVHLAGTKGKGSTAAMLESILRHAGLRTGLFTSPHLSDARERIRIDGEPIPREELAERMTEIAPSVIALEQEGPEHAPTFFEVGTALGFLQFLRANVDLAVVEVGLGGNYDSTNVCMPMISMITHISYDHIQQLGPKLAGIARQKAGIIKPHRPVVCTATATEATEVIEAVARERDSELIQLGRDFFYEYEGGMIDDRVNREVGTACRAVPDSEHLESVAKGQGPSLPEGSRSGTARQAVPTEDERPGSANDRKSRVRVSTREREWPWMELGLMGEHQAANAAGAVQAIELLRREGIAIPDEAIFAGLANMTWPARLEVISRRPLVILDCAHNVASITALVEMINASVTISGRRSLIIGTSNDKDISGMVAILATAFDRVFVTSYGTSPRAVPPRELARAFHAVNPHLAISEHDRARDALESARNSAQTDDLIVITGSVFLAGELRPLLVGM